MPLKKRNKHKTCVIRAMKTRMLEISIRVDSYIYKNKPITLEDAEKYVEEISIYRSQCYNDKQILQVTEKLTRCMKTIIEEIGKKVQSNKNVDKIDLLPESSELKNKHEDINTKRLVCNLPTTSEAVSHITAPKSSTEVVNVHSDNKNKEKDRQHNSTEDINELFRGNGSKNVNNNNNKPKTCKGNSKKNVSSGNTLTMRHVSQSRNTNVQNTNQLNPVQEYTHIDHKPKKINNNCNLTPRNSENKQNSKKKTKSIANTQQIVTSLMYHTNIGNNKNKNSETAEKHIAKNRALNLQATLGTKTKKLKGTSEKNKSRMTKKKSLKTSIEKTNKAVPSNFGKQNNTSPSQASASLHKHTHIDIISDEVSLPVANVSNNELKNVIPNQDLITKQKDTLKIYSECVLNDLSWIENIRYVREIDRKEFDQAPNKLNEIFWDNFSVPDVCNDVDFHD